MEWQCDQISPWQPAVLHVGCLGKIRLNFKSVMNSLICAPSVYFVGHTLKIIYHWAEIQLGIPQPHSGGQWRMNWQNKPSWKGQFGDKLFRSRLTFCGPVSTGKHCAHFRRWTPRDGYWKAERYNLKRRLSSDLCISFASQWIFWNEPMILLTRFTYVKLGRC